MRILVCGDRDFKDEPLMRSVLIEHFRKPSDVLIHGMAKGADQLSETVICELFNTLGRCLAIERYPADWDKHGKAAGPIRNKQMLDEGKPDLVIAFLAEHSKGTKNMIEQAQKAGVKVEIINV